MSLDTAPLHIRVKFAMFSIILCNSGNVYLLQMLSEISSSNNSQSNVNKHDRLFD